MKRLLFLFILFPILAHAQISFPTVKIQNCPTAGKTCNIPSNNGNVAYNITLHSDVLFVQTDIGSNGAEMFLNICQDNGGGHAWVWPGGIQNAPPILQAGNACTSATFINQGGGIWINQGVGNGVGNALILHGNGPPSNPPPCNLGTAYTDDLTGNYYSCNAGTFLFVGPSSTTALSGCTTDTFTATPTYNFGPDQCHIMTLTGNVTSITISGSPTNHSALYLKFPQDGTGGRTVNFPGTFIFPTGCTLHAAANAQNNFGWQFDTNASLWRPIVDFCSSGGGGGSPAGSNNAVQIQNGGSFAASGNLFDTGSLLQVNEDSQHQGPNPSVDIRSYGARAVSSSPTAPITCTSGSPTVTVGTVTGSAFQVGDYIFAPGCGAPITVATPSAPTVTSGASAMQTVPDAIVNAITGSSTYSYLLVTKDSNGGLTLPSTTTTITNGVASLGQQTATVSSATSIGQTLTITLGSNGPPNGTLIHLSYIAQGVNQTQHKFDGYYNVASGGGTTSIVVNNMPFWSNTTDSTAAEIVWMNGNALSWTNQTGAWTQYVCGKRPGDAGFHFLGSAVPASGNGTAFAHWVDWGNTITPKSPTGIPEGTDSICTASSATNDYLDNVKISSCTANCGSGSTWTLSGNAGTSTSSTVNQDSAPALTAANTANNNAGVGLTIPCPTSGFALNFYSPQALTSQRNWVDQCGFINLFETIDLGNVAATYGLPWIGRTRSQLNSNSQNIFFSAYPALNNVGVLENIVFNTNGNDSSLAVIENTGQTSNGNQTFMFDHNQFVGNGFGSIGVIGISVFPFGYIKNTKWNYGPTNSSANYDATWTPVLYLQNGGEISISNSYGFGRGTYINQTSTAGPTQLDMDQHYVQGALMPMVGLFGGNAVSFYINGRQWVNDTSPQPMISLQTNPASPLSTAHIRIRDMSGLPANTITGWAATDVFDEGGTVVTGFPYPNYVFPDPNTNFGRLALQTNTNTDAFNRSSLGSSWTNTLNSIVISGNQVTGGSGGVWNVAYEVGSNPLPNTGTAAYLGGQFCDITVTGYSSSTGGCTVLTGANSGGTGVGIGCVSTGSAISIQVPNGSTLAGPTSYTGGGAGDRLYGTATVTPGASNVAIACTVYPVSGTPTTITASTAATGKGVPGVAIIGTSMTEDNFSGGTLNPISYLNVENDYQAPQHFISGTVGSSAPIAGALTPGDFYANNFIDASLTSGNCVQASTGGKLTTVSNSCGGTWNSIGNPTGNMSLTMGSDTSIFNYNTSLSSAFGWDNTTAATVVTSQSSPQIFDCGQAWHSGASAQDCWTFQHIIGNGTDAAITDTYGHTGSSTGVVTSTFPGPVSAGAGSGPSGAVIIPQGTTNSNTAAAITLQAPTAVTNYRLSLPGAQPTTGANFLSCTAADPSICSFVIGGNGIGAGASPIMGFYLSPACPTSNTGSCFNTPANTQQSNGCAYTASSTTVNCYSYVGFVTGSVTSNVATYSGLNNPSNNPIIPSNWASGNTLVVQGFTGGDTFFNQTCTISATTTTTVTCPLTHANASSTTNGNMQNTSVPGPFVSADTGKRIMGFGTCRTSFDLTSNVPMTTGTQLTMTYVSSTQATLSSNAANTGPQGSCVIWGSPDDTGAAAMDTAMQAANQCPRAILAAGYYFFTTPHFFTLPPACAALGVNYPNGVNQGNMIYSAGYELDGRGAGTTVIFIPPGFPETGGCTNGKSGKGCFVIPTEGRWSNLQITGGGNYLLPSGLNGNILVEMDGPASLDNFTCTNWGNGGSTGIVTGVGAFYWSQLYQINLSSCGRQQFATNPSSTVTAIRMWIENVGSFAGIEFGALSDYGSVATGSQYNSICYDCSVNQEGNAPGSPAFHVIVNANNKVKWYRGGAFTNGPTVNGNQLVSIAAGGQFDVQDAVFDANTGAPSDQNNLAITCSGACVVHAENTVLKGSTTGGFGYKDVAGSKFFDMGANTWSTPTVSLSGSFIGPTNSARSTVCATGNFALTSGWGSSSIASVAANGDIQGCHVSITGASGSSGPVLTWTYPVAPPLAPGSCHLSGVSGTLTGVSSGTPGSTTVAYTFTGTPSAQTYNFDVGCP